MAEVSVVLPSPASGRGTRRDKQQMAQLIYVCHARPAALLHQASDQRLGFGLTMADPLGEEALFECFCMVRLFSSAPWTGLRRVYSEGGKRLPVRQVVEVGAGSC